MDVTGYYKRLREMENGISEPFPVVASLATADGGKEGTLTETPRWLAAKMVTQGLARLATPGEIKSHHEAHAEGRRKADQEATAAKLQIAVVTAAELNKLKGKGRMAED